MSLLLHSIPTWIELVSLAFCAGSLVCGLYVFAPADSGSRPDQNSNARRWMLFSFAIALMAVSAATDLVFRTAEMSNRPAGAVLPLLPVVLQKTHFGAVWLIRMAGLFLSGAFVIAGRKRLPAAALSSVLLAIAIVIAFTESASGHAADTGDFSMQELMDFLHLGGALVWGGGLFTLSLHVLPASIGKSGPQALSLARAAKRFSRTAGIAVTIVAATSLYNAWIYVGSLDALFTSPYGKAILAKIVLFVLLLVLAAFNRSVTVPRLQEWAGRPADNRDIVDRCLAALFSPVIRRQKKEMIARWFLGTVRIEAFLMLALLFCVAVLRHEVPARHAAHLVPQGAGEQSGSGHEGHMHHMGRGPAPILRLETNPAKITVGTPVVITLRLEDRNHKPFTGLMTHHEKVLHAIIVSQDLTVFAHIHPEDLGQVTNEMIRQATFPLQFTFPKAGKYLIGLDFATEEGTYSVKAYLSVFGGQAMPKPRIDLSKVKNYGNYRVSFEHSPARIKAGSDALLRFLIDQNGKPATNLEPYLGAPMHLAIVRSDLREFIHAHGFLPVNGDVNKGPSERFGPEIDAEIMFPEKGLYKIFSQVKQGEKVLLFDFAVNVE